jgi:hypothetical protein
MMIDLVLGPGLVLHAIRSVPGGSERVQIVLQGRRDPHNRGYVYLESVTGNSVRYHTGLGVENDSWSNTASSGFGLGDQQPGEPTAQVGPIGGQGGGTATSGTREGALSDIHFNPASTFTQSTGSGGYKQTMAAQRDTLFVPGPPTKMHHRYGGDLQIKLSIRKTPWDPSRLANLIGLNLPHYAASYFQDAANTRLEVPTRIVELAERVLVPHQLVHHETVPEGPGGDIAAVEEISPFVAPGNQLNITADDLLSRTVLSLGFDPEKLQILHEEAAGRLTGTDPATAAVADRAARRQGSHAVARLIEAGTRGQDLLRYALSYPMMTRELFNLVRPGGLKMPALARAGGPLTDTFGDIEVAVQFEDNPDILGYFAAWVEGGGYGFDEFQQNKSRAAGSALGAAGGVGVNTGDRSDSNPLSPKKQTANFDIQPSFGTSKTRTSDAVAQYMSRFDMWNRSLQWLRVSPNAIITVTLTARNQRDWIDLSKLGTHLGGGKFAVRYRVRNAAELGLSPEKSIDLGIYQPQGIPTGSGTFFPPPPDRRPAATSTDDLVRAAFSLPFLSAGFAVQADWDGQNFRASDRALTPAQLAAEITTRLGQLAPPPPADLPADEKPAPEPTKLDNPDDPVILASPYAGSVPPGHAIAPAQALADALGRPVIAPDSSYVIGRDGSANVIHRDAPDATDFGRGWQQGNWVAFFPAPAPAAPEASPDADGPVQPQAPRPLGFNLEDAITRAHDELGWAVEVVGPPALVPPPTHDVHFGVQTPERELARWHEETVASASLATAAREFLPQPGTPEADALRAALEQADRAVRVIPLPPAALPATAEQRAELWPDRTAFRLAAADLGAAVADVLTAAIGQWRQYARSVSTRREQARALLEAQAPQIPGLSAALDQLDQAAHAVPPPPTSLPATASELTAAARAIMTFQLRERDFHDALIQALDLAINAAAQPTASLDHQALGELQGLRGTAAPYTGLPALRASAGLAGAPTTVAGQAQFQPSGQPAEDPEVLAEAARDLIAHTGGNHGFLTARLGHARAELARASAADRSGRAADVRQGVDDILRRSTLWSRQRRICCLTPAGSGQL